MRECELPVDLELQLLCGCIPGMTGQCIGDGRDLLGRRSVLAIQPVVYCSVRDTEATCHLFASEPGSFVESPEQSTPAVLLRPQRRSWKIGLQAGHPQQGEYPERQVYDRESEELLYSQSTIVDGPGPALDRRKQVVPLQRGTVHRLADDGHHGDIVLAEEGWDRHYSPVDKGCAESQQDLLATVLAYSTTVEEAPSSPVAEHTLVETKCPDDRSYYLAAICVLQWAEVAHVVASSRLGGSGKQISRSTKRSPGINAPDR